MRLDQLNGLIAFARVAEAASFTRAAAALGVSAPSLSEAVRVLEGRLGVRLLTRTTRSVGLTEAGAAYLARVAPALAEIEAAATATRESGDRVAGTLRLTLPWIAGPLLLEPVAAPFLERHPEVRLDVVFGDGLADLASGRFDAGVRIGDLIDRDMVAARVGPPLQAAVLASPDYLARHGTPGTVAALQAHRCIAYRFESTGLLSPWDFVVDGEAVAFVPTPVAAFNAMVAVVDAAVAGIGIAFTTRRLAARPLADGRLVPLLEDACPAYEPLHVYYASRRLVPPKLAAFIAVAREVADRDALADGPGEA